MGKYAKFFCIGVPSTLIILGLIVTVYTVLNMIVAIRTQRTLGELPNPIVAIFTVTFLFYAFIGISNLCVGLTVTKDFDGHLRGYAIFSLIGAVVASLDAVYKFQFGFQFTLQFLVYSVLLCFCTYMTYIGKQEYQGTVQGQLNQFNSGQGGSGNSSLPKFAMPIHVEKVE